MRTPLHEPDIATSVLTHHSESVDPTLAQWINDLLHDLLGWGPWTFIIILGLTLILIPLWLIYNTLKHPAPNKESDPDET